MPEGIRALIMGASQHPDYDYATTFPPGSSASNDEDLDMNNLPNVRHAVNVMGLL